MSIKIFYAHSTRNDQVFAAYKKVKEYIEEQIDRLLENALNQRVAAELLKDRQEVSALFELAGRQENLQEDKRETERFTCGK